MLHEIAPAKINLFLHVLGRREDGYHHLESLVSFADIGDMLTLEPDEKTALLITGPFAAPLAGEDNLVMKAMRAFTAVFGRAKAGRFHLEKNLPVASGIGGGSSDAAAALRLLAAANGIARDDERLIDAAQTLGADVPVCLDPVAPRLMQGIGHHLGNRLHGLRHPALLINPGIPVETRAVFSQLGLAPGERCASTDTPPSTPDDPIAALLAARNDLEAPALALAPIIAEALMQLRHAPGCALARMSGSGATCFGLFETRGQAANAARDISALHPEWWVQPSMIKLPV